MSVQGLFSSELKEIKRLGQFTRMSSRIRSGEMVDAYNDSKSLFDYIAKLQYLLKKE